MELRHGEIVFISEILSNPNRFNGHSVRVLGTMMEMNVVQNTTTIEYKGSKMIVDSSLLGPFEYKINSLFQCIGELDSSRDGELVLHARVMRNVDGLDLALYEKSLELRRKFEKKLQDERDQSN